MLDQPDDQRQHDRTDHCAGDAGDDRVAQAEAHVQCWQQPLGEKCTDDADHDIAEQVCTWSRLREGREAIVAEIQDYLRHHLVCFKVLQYVRFVVASPMTVTDKVQKYLMRGAMEAVLAAAASAGARRAGYTTLRLPHELKQLFREWLALHAPQRAAHVMSLVQQMNAGRDYDSNFATRMHGQGVFADLLRRRFDVACRKHGLNRERDNLNLDATHFAPPRPPTPQGDLFG